MSPHTLATAHASRPATPRTQRTRSTSPRSTSCIALPARRRPALTSSPTPHTQQPRAGLAADVRVQRRRVHPAPNPAHGAAEQVRRRQGAGIRLARCGALACASAAKRSVRAAGVPCGERLWGSEDSAAPLARRRSRTGSADATPSPSSRRTWS